MNIVNFYHKAIELMVENGHTIIQVIIDKETILYFLVFDFQPSFFSNVESLDFNTLKGYNITEFLELQAGNPGGMLINQLDKLILGSTAIRFQFSNNIKWTKWANAAK